MSQPSDNQRRPTYEELAAENTYLRKRVAELESVIEDLRAQVEELRRSSKRQAAPFSKGKPKQNPKRSGRKKGHPPAHRLVPEAVDRIEDVELPFHICPDCGGFVEVVEVQSQYQTDIPPIHPVTTRFDIEVGQCHRCGKRMQGRHREQTSDALGSAAVQIGPQSLALGCQMKHELGLSYGKIQSFFESIFHFSISRATFSRADTRLCNVFEPTYAQLILSIREKEVYDHLEHISRSASAKGLKLIVTPFQCLNCGFLFKDRQRFTRPGRCPQCKGGHIRMATYRVQS